MLLMYFRVIPPTQKHPPRIKLQAHMGRWRTVVLPEGDDKKEISLLAAQAAGFKATHVGSIVQNVQNDVDWVAYVAVEA